MHVTTAICTWNRANLLDGTLASLARVDIPPGITHEVIVANNNSTDHTDQVLARHSHRLPLTRLLVPRQGKSFALNEVVARLTGDLVLWTDDDVRMGSNWVTSYVDATRRWPRASFFGGHVIPYFLADEPEWLRPAWPIVSGVYAARELGDEPFAFDRKRLPFGANMAVRVSMQKQYSYDPQLGRRGPLLLAGEETALMHQWLADGHVGMWVPDSRVDHVITPDRLELDHLRRFFFSLAESNHPEQRKAMPFLRMLRAAWYTAKALKYHVRSALGTRSTSSARRQVKYLTRTSYCWGRVESQWGGFPQWLKPGPVRQLKIRREQPRFDPAICLPAVRAFHLHGSMNHLTPGNNSATIKAAA